MQITLVVPKRFRSKDFLLSRKRYPEQHLPLAGDNTTPQEAIFRLSGLGNII